MQSRFGKYYPGDEPIPFSTILDTCGLAYAILCCKAEPQYYSVWYHYAVDCLNTVRHLMGAAAAMTCLMQRSVIIWVRKPGYPGYDLRNRVFGATHAAYLTALCKRMDNKVSDDELKKACAKESVAIGVLALTQNKIDVAVEAVIEVAEPQKLAAIINHFLRIVDAGWSPLVVDTATLAKAESVDLEPQKPQEPELQPLYLSGRIRNLMTKR